MGSAAPWLHTCALECARPSQVSVLCGGFLFLTTEASASVQGAVMRAVMAQANQSVGMLVGWLGKAALDAFVTPLAL